MAKEAKEMGFLQHLEELRWHLVRSAVAVVGCMVLAFIAKDILFNKFLLWPIQKDFPTNELFKQIASQTGWDLLLLNQTPYKFINTQWAGQFLVHLRVAFIAGVVASAPYIFWEFWRFLRPALYSHEERVARGAVAGMSALFFIGVLFGYFLLIPISSEFMMNYSVSSQVETIVEIGNYASTFTSLILAAGILFELPVVIIILTKVGIVTASSLKFYRRHAFVALLILSAIITPPDIFSQLLVCGPLIILYEISIMVAKRIEKKRKLKEQEEEQTND